MKILILEDSPDKLADIVSQIQIFDSEVDIVTASNQFDFTPLVERQKYDLIIIDLMVPMFEGQPPTDLTEMLILRIRDDACINIETPVLALTKYIESAYKCVDRLDAVGLQICAFSDDDKWKNWLLQNLKICKPQTIYDFVIICALKKEAKAFEEVLPNISASEEIQGLECRKVMVGNSKGLIVTCPRMGLVAAAITATKAIEYFKPSIICMSGICAGLESSGANIYDVVLSDTCYQHDSGKWTNEGFVLEPYQIQLKPEVKTFINSSIIDNNVLLEELTIGIVPSKSEYHDDYIKPSIKLAITSSGSSVVADDTMLNIVENGHRKVNSFEMETFAIYESARMSSLNPKYFSCKCVVDNGNSEKGDNYHRLACLFAAKCTVSVLSGLLNSN